MTKPMNCGDCTIATPSQTPGKVSCPINDRLKAIDATGCYDPATATRWHADSVAHILSLGAWLPPW
jgi:hypothetical protein